MEVEPRHVGGLGLDWVGGRRETGGELAVAVSAGVVLGQGQRGQHKPEVFCEGLSAGQLCLLGTADVLKLQGAKKDRWNEISRQYNNAVDAATKELLQEAKATLSLEEFTRVETWFDRA